MSRNSGHAMRWLWLAPLALSGVLGYLGWHKEQTGLEPALLTINVTIAIFAVNFSFLEYQFSPYRAVLRGVSPLQLAASVAVLVLAIAPLVGLVATRTWLPTIALISIPLVASASVLLGMLARREASAVALLSRAVSPRALGAFLNEFVEEIRAHLKELEDLQLSKPGGMPTHEYETRTAPETRADDPFNLLASLGSIAIQNSDLHTFQRVVTQALEAARTVGEWKESGESLDLNVRRVLERHAREAIHRLGTAACELDKTETSATKFLDTCAGFVWKRSGENAQTSDVVVVVMWEMSEVAKRLLHKGDTGASSALIPVVVARQAAQKGIEAGKTDPLFHHDLGYLPRQIKILGQEAIAVGDANYLYRCLDAFWWLGVEAVKADELEVGKGCFGALAQLGREARAKKLECFWSHCATQPPDHANERILSTGGCIMALDPDRRPKWLDVVAEALSRLHGTVHKVMVVDRDGEPAITYRKTDKPYQVRYSDRGGDRTIDYSDPAMTKDLDLYGEPQALRDSESPLVIVTGPLMPIGSGT
ncbi:MAG: hypothetical protein WCC53_15865 [Thermoanaerobaculia bacterium]